MKHSNFNSNDVIGRGTKYDYECLCSCGKTVIVGRQAVIKKRKVSCGCAGIGNTEIRYKSILLEKKGGDRISWNWMHCESAVQYWNIIELYFLNKNEESLQRFRFTRKKADLLILPGELIVPLRLKDIILSKKHEIFEFARYGNSSFRYET
jgi:hypothetical protein